MTASWQDVRWASIPIEALPALGELRGQPGIYVSIDRAQAWIWWEANCDQMRELLVRRSLAQGRRGVVHGAERTWYRLGEHLPAFDVPAGESATGVRPPPAGAPAAGLGGAEAGRETEPARGPPCHPRPVRS